MLRSSWEEELVMYLGKNLLSIWDAIISELLQITDALKNHSGGRGIEVETERLSIHPLVTPQIPAIIEQTRAGTIPVAIHEVQGSNPDLHCGW